MSLLVSFTAQALYKLHKPFLGCFGTNGPKLVWKIWYCKVMWWEVQFKRLPHAADATSSLSVLIFVFLSFPVSFAYRSLLISTFFLWAVWMCEYKLLDTLLQFTKKEKERESKGELFASTVRGQGEASTPWWGCFLTWVSWALLIESTASHSCPKAPFILWNSPNWIGQGQCAQWNYVIFCLWAGISDASIASRGNCDVTITILGCSDVTIIVGVGTSHHHGDITVWATVISPLLLDSIQHCAPFFPACRTHIFQKNYQIHHKKKIFSSWVTCLRVLLLTILPRLSTEELDVFAGNYEELLMLHKKFLSDLRDVEKWVIVLSFLSGGNKSSPWLEYGSALVGREKLWWAGFSTFTTLLERQVASFLQLHLFRYISFFLARKTHGPVQDLTWGTLSPKAESNALNQLATSSQSRARVCLSYAQ